MSVINDRYIPESVICRMIGAKAEDHCSSCHAEDDAGWDSLTQRDLGKGRETTLCCKIAGMFDAWKKRRGE